MDFAETGSLGCLNLSVLAEILDAEGSGTYKAMHGLGNGIRL